MGKRIFYAIVSGVILAGILCGCIGYALGGRLGSFSLNNGRLTYENGRDSYLLLPGNGAADTGRATADTPAPAVSSASAAASTAPLSGDVELAAVQKLSIDITAGYLVVQSGTELAFTVDGDLPYESWMEGNTFHLRAVHQHIRVRDTRFFLNDADVTTTFTLTLPQNLEKMDISLGMGEMEVTDFTLAMGEFSVDLGTLEMEDVDAAILEMDAALGTIEARNVTADTCTLDAELGSISFKGDISQYLESDCELGSIYVQIPRPASYGCTAKTELGHIQIDGTSYRNVDNGHKDTSLPFFDLSCELGSIEIAFT